MILEGIVTTRNDRGRVNVAPMGPTVGPRGLDGDRLAFRPWQGSRTYENLRRFGRGVFHTTDDVLLIARAAVGDVDPETAPVTTGDDPGFDVPRLADCCRWRAFRVQHAAWNERAEVETTAVAEGRVRDFFGLNRAKHAVLEATILATRLHLSGRDPVLTEIERLRPLIDKTAGPDEQAAFALIERRVRDHGG